MAMIRSTLLALILLCATLYSVGSPAHTSAASAPHPMPLIAAQADRELLNFVIQDIDAFWSSAFVAAGEPYSSPEVVPSDGSLWTGCGRADPYADGPLYCGFDQTIYYSPTTFSFLERQAGDFAWITVLAHEWGHHVQLLIGVEQSRGNAFELQADCLAGAYAQDARAQGLLDPGDVTEAVAVSAAAGDPLWLPQDEIGTHGTSDDRITAFMRGYLDGAMGCDLPVALPAGSRTASISRPGLGTSPVNWLPEEADVPGGLELIEEGGRSAREIAAGFPNPREASSLLAAWGFQENVYRTFAGSSGRATPNGTVYMEVSLHAFATSSGAAEAIPYYAAGRADVLGHAELSVSQVGEQTEAVGGRVDAGVDVTVYARAGSLLVRVSALAMAGDPTPDALAVARAVVSAANGTQASSSLASILPEGSEIAAGLVMIVEGVRTKAEVAATFLDPTEAAERLTEWGFRGNAYRSFAEADAVAQRADRIVSLEVSLHWFGSADDAAEALTHFSEARSEALGLHAVTSPDIPAGAEMISGVLPAGQGTETTVYVRVADVVARVSVVSDVDPTPVALRVADLVARNADRQQAGTERVASTAESTTGPLPLPAETGECSGATIWSSATEARLIEADAALGNAVNNLTGMTPNPATVEADADRVARLADDQWSSAYPPAARALNTAVVGYLQDISQTLTLLAQIAQIPTIYPPEYLPGLTAQLDRLALDLPVRRAEVIQAIGNFKSACGLP